MFVLESGETSGEGSREYSTSYSLDTDLVARPITIPAKRSNLPTGTVDKRNCRGP